MLLVIKKNLDDHDAFFNFSCKYINIVPFCHKHTIYICHDVNITIYRFFFFIFLSLSHFVVRLWLNLSLFHIVVFFMSYGGWFVLNIAVGMLQFYSGRSILLITRLNNSLGLFTICDKRQLERKATCSLVTLKPIYHNNPAKG